MGGEALEELLRMAGITLFEAGMWAIGERPEGWKLAVGDAVALDPEKWAEHQGALGGAPAKAGMLYTVRELQWGMVPFLTGPDGDPGQIHPSHLRPAVGVTASLYRAAFTALFAHPASAPSCCAHRRSARRSGRRRRCLSSAVPRWRSTRTCW